MAKAIPMTSNGRTFLVETDEAVEVPAGYAPPAPPDLAGVPEGMDAVADVGALARQFADVQSLIATCCNSLYESLSQLPHPEKVAVEFGVKLGGEAGVPMLTKASGEANFKVHVEWKPPPRA
ncbi:MAG TPA: CU044_2847 family protein [Burkholderiaceae bacterium]|nr:CU044_2847 family protein [Burkholderiaceae bacterium]